MRLILIAQKTTMPTCKIPINQGVINIGTPTIPTNRSIKKTGGPTLHSKGRGPPQPRGPTSSAKCVTEKSHATRMPLLKKAADPGRLPGSATPQQSTPDHHAERTPQILGAFHSPRKAGGTCVSCAFLSERERLGHSENFHAPFSLKGGG